MGRAGVEFQQHFVAEGESVHDFGAAYLGGVRNDGDDGGIVGKVFAGGAQGGGNHGGEVRVKGRLAIPRKGDRVGALVAFAELGECRIKRPFHLCAGGQGGVTAPFGVPAAFAIHTVVVANLFLCRQEVYSQRRSQPPAVYRPGYDMCVKERHTYLHLRFAKVMHFSLSLRFILKN